MHFIQKLVAEIMQSDRDSDRAESIARSLCQTYAETPDTTEAIVAEVRRRTAGERIADCIFCGHPDRGCSTTVRPFCKGVTS